MTYCCLCRRRCKEEEGSYYIVATCPNGHDEGPFVSAIRYDGYPDRAIMHTGWIGPLRHGAVKALQLGNHPKGLVGQAFLGWALIQVANGAWK